jgi:PAS domain S-box-containing protein
MSRTITALAADSGFLVELFDHLDDVAFFVKDAEARYVLVNQSLVRRCGGDSREDLLGRTTEELFPPPLGRRYREQDLAVMSSGRPLAGRLELHLYPDHSQGWCLTDKTPISDDGRIIGLVGLSRDLQPPALEAGDLEDVATVVDTIQREYSSPIRVDDLAASVGLSAYQLNRRVRAVFGVTASQLLTRARIDAASHLLRDGHRTVAAIAAACGYCDQSAFSRQFKAACGLTPRQYRDRYVD